MFKCWNCHGTGLIEFEGEDLDYGTMTFGDDCPICHGKPWLLVLIQKAVFELKQRLANTVDLLNKEQRDFLKWRKSIKNAISAIECGQPSYLVSFDGEHPELYSDELLKKMKHHWFKEALGLVGGLLIITSMFIGLVLIL